MATAQPLSEQTGTGAACYGCGRRLPLRLAECNEEAALWECVSCHSSFAGVLSREILQLLALRIRLGDTHFQVPQTEPLPYSLIEGVRDLAFREPPHKIQDLRRSTRLSGEREVVVVPVHGNHAIGDTPLTGVIANLSRHGMLLVTPGPLSSPSVIVQVASD